MRTYRGITLLELMLGLTIASILTTLVVPALASLKHKTEARQRIFQIQRIIQASRSLAITSAYSVVLCPIGVGRKCVNDWNKKLIVFEDINNNLTLDSNERILSYIDPSYSHEQRNFNGQYIQFKSNGSSAFQTGSFGYCSKKKLAISQSFIISRMGRIRKGAIDEKTGLSTLANGNLVQCG